MKNLKVLVLAAAMFVVPIAANSQTTYAQMAYTSKDVHLRAGPARDYPVVAILGSGFPVTIQGCMQDYSWCDVIAGEYRGWVYARNLAYTYQGAGVPVIDYGAAIGIGVVTFIVASYWHDHYIDRPWYRQLPQWSHRPPRARVNRRPPQAAARPTGMQRPIPAFRPSRLPPKTGIAQRRPPVGASPGGKRLHTPTNSSPQRAPSAGAKLRPPQREARRGGAGQYRTPGSSHAARSRQ